MNAEMPSGKVVIVTGALGQVARTVARTLNQSGFDVIPVDRIAGNVEGIPEVIACDVTDAAQVAALMEHVKSRGAGLYGLVNAAAVIPTAGVDDVGAEEFAAVMNVNAWGSFNMAREASLLMTEGGLGRIINIASVAAYSGGLVGGPHYAASKAALLVLTKILAKELAGRGITVNAIAPGALDSPATKALSDDSRDALLTRIPKGRFGRREEIAAAVEFLLTPAADYMTGATLDINGGVHLR
jgi:3-oxoacyl-[acyl-carrier protein] reductase